MKDKENPAFERLFCRIEEGAVLALLRLMIGNMTVGQKKNLLTSAPVADILKAGDSSLSGRDLVELYENWLIDAEEAIEEVGYTIKNPQAFVWIWENVDGGSEDFDTREDAIEDAIWHLQYHQELQNLQTLKGASA